MTNLAINQDIEIDEAQLIAALKSGDNASFEILVREYGGYMLTIARRYFSNEADAQDSVQDAYLQAYRAIGKFEGRSSLKSWLHRIVVNAALMKIRSTSRHGESFIDDSDSLFSDKGKRIEQDSEISLSVETLTISKQTREQVRSYIGQLPENSRNLLLLRDIEGYSTEETSEMLGMSIPSVKTGLHRARNSLKKLLTNHAH